MGFQNYLSYSLNYDCGTVMHLKLKTKFSGFIRLLMAVFALVFTANAQIQVTLPDMLKLFNAGDHHYGTNFGGQINIGSPGANQVYDFTYIPLLNELSYNYNTDNIPILASRYPGCVTFGDSPQTIEKNPVFKFSTDSFYIPGQASLVPQWQFLHREPFDVFPLPVIYTGIFSRYIKLTDSTFNTSGVLQHVDTSSCEYRSHVDGWGTLKIGSMQFPCLRVKREYINYGDKDFVYLTKDGAFVTLMTAATSPDSGWITGGGTILLSMALVDANEVSPVPAEFNLAQNYPNPFNPTTVIRYSLPSSGYAKLEVFDILGNAVSVLFEGEASAGEHSAEFDASRLGSGAYFYRLTFNNTWLTRKMTLLK